MNRRGFIGGSTVAAILGISPYSSAWAEWASIVGLRGDSEDTERFDIARDLEVALARAFTRKTGLWTAGEQLELAHPRYPMMVGHVDGLAFDGPQEGNIGNVWPLALGVVEHKTQFGPKWVEVPAYYQAQAQFYLWLTGLDRCWFSVLFSGFQHEVYELKADRADQALIAWKAWRFWQDHCVTGIAPATDGSNATLAALADVYPEHVPDKAVELDDNGAEAARQCVLTAAKIREWEHEHAVAKATLMAILGDAEEGTVAGERVVTWRQQTRAAHHVAESTFRVLRPVQPKGTGQ